MLRPDLRSVVDALLAAHAGAITLDAIGEAIGARAVSNLDIEAILDALEAAGRAIVAPSDRRASAALAIVIRAARGLRSELGRTPTTIEIAERAGLARDDVRTALLLATILQR